MAGERSDLIVNVVQLFQWSMEEEGRGLINKLMDFGALPKEGTYMCPRGHALKLYKNCTSLDKFSWKCGKSVQCGKKKSKPCGYSVSLRKGTFFARSKLSILQVCIFVRLWVSNCCLNIICDEARISYKTGVDWGSFCREVLEHSFYNNRQKIGGVGKIVEIDESKFGKRKYHRGHRVEGQWVFGGIERGSGRCFLVPVEKRDADTLIGLIREWILPGTTIISDFWKAYDKLQDEGYHHLKVNHSINFVDEETGAHTNSIESTWRQAKVTINATGTKKIFYSGYLAKYMFIKMCIQLPCDRTLEFFKLAGLLYNPTNGNLQHEDDDVDPENPEVEDHVECGL